jgi:ribosomal protein S18 acetylase RimI-like enzyme
MHELDNPAWYALTGPHATVAERAALAARYEPDVSVFSALPDDATPDAWDALRDLVGPGAVALFMRRELSVPEFWSVQFEAECRQMWLPTTSGIAYGTATDSDPRRDVSLEPLGAPDVDDMLALVERTKPGPFVSRTVELGTYLGIRDNGALIAMAGERMHPAGFTEISAVCTDDSYRGRGLASHLVRTVARGIRDRNEIPFLHLTMQNETARRVYAALGFDTRANLQVTGVRAPS